MQEVGNVERQTHLSIYYRQYQQLFLLSRPEVCWAVGQRVKRMRKWLGMNQKMLGQRLQTPRSITYVSNLEAGRVSLTPALVIALAETLGCTYDWLMEEIEAELDPCPNSGSSSSNEA